MLFGHRVHVKLLDLHVSGLGALASASVSEGAVYPPVPTRDGNGYSKPEYPNTRQVLPDIKAGME